MFYDCHLHTRTKDGLPRDATGDNYATPEELIAIMDATGVEKGVLLPGVNPECRKMYSPTEDILDVVQRYPKRFIAFCNIDPRAETNSTDADFSRSLEYYKRRGCKGVGEICANLNFDDPLVLNLFRHCERCQLPVLFHVGFQSGGCYGLVDTIGFPRLEKCLMLFPKLVFIAHSQPFWASLSGDITYEQWANAYPTGPINPGGAVERLLDSYPNLYCDTSAKSGYNALTRDPEYGYAFIEKYQDRLLFGTDVASPRNNHKHAQYFRDALATKRISQGAFNKISHVNLSKLLSLV